MSLGIFMHLDCTSDVILCSCIFLVQRNEMTLIFSHPVFLNLPLMSPAAFQPLYHVYWNDLYPLYCRPTPLAQLTTTSPQVSGHAMGARSQHLPNHSLQSCPCRLSQCVAEVRWQRRKCLEEYERGDLKWGWHYSRVSEAPQLPLLTFIPIELTFSSSIKYICYWWIWTIFFRKVSECRDHICCIALKHWKHCCA